jgi:hypothetical protein
VVLAASVATLLELSVHWVVVNIWVCEILIVLIGRLETRVLFEGLTVKVVVHAAGIGYLRRLVLVEDPGRVSYIRHRLSILLGRLQLLLMHWTSRDGLWKLTLHEYLIAFEGYWPLVVRIHHWLLPSEAVVLLSEEVLLLLLMQMHYFLILMIRRPLKLLQPLKFRWRS